MTKPDNEPQGATRIDPEILSDLRASKQVQIGSCERVCLALGPYRNLTTLTGSVLFLHPNCQVLNHARDRVYNIPEVDFLSSYSAITFNRFIQYAIFISGKGRRGRYGGSITYSHAFDSGHEMANVFRRTGFDLVKDKIHCLFWKESLAASNFLRDHQVNIDELLIKEKRLVFLLPIRNPLDCAVSNIRSGHASRFRGLDCQPSVGECLLAILDEINWFLSLQARHPDRFFHYYAHSIDSTMLFSLASFLGLTAFQKWIDDGLSVMVVKSAYAHDQALFQLYQQNVKSVFSDKPEAIKQLLKYLPV